MTALQLHTDPMTFAVSMPLGEGYEEAVSDMVCDQMSVPRGTDISALSSHQRTLYRKLERAVIHGIQHEQQWDNAALCWCWDNVDLSKFTIKFTYHPYDTEECALVEFTDPGPAALFKLTFC